MNTAKTPRQTITHNLDVFEFGKHKGKTARYVAEHEPSYIFWLDSSGIVKFSQEILDDAEDSRDDEDFDVPDRDYGDL